jgi:hypothetical protein
VNGATITINRENTVKTLVTNDASLRFTGASPVTIMGNGKAQSPCCVLGTNVWFDNVGKVKFSGNEKAELSGAHFGLEVTEILFDNSPQSVFSSANSTTVIPCDLTFTNNAYLYGAGTLAFNTTSGDHVFSGPIHGTDLTMRKLGANTLTVSSTTNIPHLKIEEGTLLLKSTIAAKTLSVAAGATVTVTDSLKIENGATVNAINGGKIVRLSDVATTTDLRGEMIRSWDLIKTGAGELRLYDPQLSGFVRAAEGTLKFSKQGLSDRYIKLTFKELLQFWYGGSYSSLKGLCTRVVFYDTSAALCLDSSSYNTRFVLGTHPSALTKGEVTAPADTVWTQTNNDYGNPFFMFRSSGGVPPVWKTGAMTNAEDKVNFQILYYRLPDVIPTALDGVNLYSRWTYGNPKKWTLETSATGEDGTWHEVLAVDERTPGMSNNNCEWLNGNSAKPAYLLSYDERLEAASQVVLPDVRFKRGDIAYLYGFLNGKGLPCYTDGNHIDYLNWFDALEFSGLRADVFGERNFIEKVNPKDYPVLVVPHTRMVRGETFAHFKDYVRQGGTAIITDDALTMTFERYAKTDIGEFATDCGKGRVIVVRGKPQMEELMKVLKPYLPEAKVKVEEVAGTTAPAARTEPPLIERVLAGNDDRKVLYLANWGGMKHTVKVTLPEEVRGWQATLIEGNPSSVSCLSSEITLTVPSQDLVAFMLERPGAKVAPLDLEADPKVVATLKRIAELNEARPAHKGPKALFPKWSKCYGQAMGKELYPYVLDRLAALGCHAEEEDIEMWTPELLAEYAVVVLPETNTQKLFRDKAAMDALGKKLDAYVRNGGSLLVMAYTGYTPNIYAYLLTSWIGFSPYFGVDLGTDAYDVKRGALGDPCQILSDAIVPGPLTEGVERVQLHYLRTIDAPKGWKVRAEPVVKIPDDCERGGGRSAMMALELGRGRVVLIADLMMFQPFRIGFADNAALLVNTAGWLLRKPVTQEMRDDFRKRGLFIERVVPSADKAGIPGDRK